MLRYTINNIQKKTTILVLASLVMVACSHQSTVKPSEGHIDTVVPDKQAKRQILAQQQLPELVRRMRELEKQVEELRAKLGG